MRRSALILTFVLLLFGSQTANAEWVKQTTNTFAWFKDIFFTPQQKGWIVGSEGIVLWSPDAGNTWIQAKKFTNDTILQVHFTDEKTGWLLCQRNVFERGKEPVSYLRKTTDGGLTWDKIEFADAGRERVTKLVFNRDGTGIAFGEGGIFYKLQEDGVTWKKNQTSIHYLLLDGGFSDDGSGALVGAGGTIMFTEDGGFTWQKATVLGGDETRFNAVFFSAAGGAWAVGSGGKIYHTNTTGRLWRSQNSTVTANLNDVVFTSPSNGWAVGDNGIIVRTRDGGNTWMDVDSHVTNKLEKIVFASGRGWAIGYGGTVLTYTDIGTRDPGKKPVLERRG